MTKIRLILSLLISYLAISCSLILGFSEPKILSEAKFKKAIEKNRIPSEACVYIKPSAIDSLKNEAYKPGWEKGFRPIQLLAYTNGKLVAQYASCEGSLKQTGFLSSFPPKNIHPFDSSKTINSELAMMDVQHLDKEILEANTVLFVYWATWLGTPAKNLISKTQEYTKAHSNESLGLVYVNISEQL